MHVFASDLLGMLPIMLCFLEDAVVTLGVMIEHTRCFRLLCQIVAIVQLGPEKAMPYLDKLRALIEDHHTTWKKLYGTWGIKSKWHQLMHLPLDALRVGKMLSCFVTERKHKDTKSAAMWVFRNMEHTVAATIVNRTSASMIAADAFYSPASLVDPKPFAAVHGAMLSKAARLPCGEVHQGDVVYLMEPAVVGRLAAFWEKDGRIVAMVERFAMHRGSSTVWSTASASVAFVDAAEDIVAPLPWYPKAGGLIRVVLPIVAVLE